MAHDFFAYLKKQKSMRHSMVLFIIVLLPLIYNGKFKEIFLKLYIFLFIFFNTGLNKKIDKKSNQN